MKNNFAGFKTQTDEQNIATYRDKGVSPYVKQTIQAHFYKKYLPLFKSLSNKYYYVESIEDNIQECYLRMYSILEDPEEIIQNNELGWRLKANINSHFQWKAKRLKDHETKEYIEISGDIQTDKIHRSVSIPLIPNVSFENRLIFDIHFEEFKKQLTPYELKLVNLLETNMQKKVVAKEMGYKHTANLAPLRKRLKEKYLKFMENSGYEIQTEMTA